MQKSLDAAGIPQQKILHDEFPFVARERSTANAARYVAIIGYWAGLDFERRGKGRRNFGHLRKGVRVAVWRAASLVNINAPSAKIRP